MTIGQQTPIVKYQYTNPATFSFSFKILKDEDIAVYHTDAATGISSALVLNTDYTVNFNVNVQGGDVVVSFNGADGAIEIRRDMAIEQTVNFVNNERLDMEIIERAYDRLTMLIQQYLIELQEGTGTSNFRGVWAANTLYKAGELVTFPDSLGSMYLAANEHTSGTDFAVDLAAGNWKLFIDTASLTALKIAAELAALNAAASETASAVSAGQAAASALAASQYGVELDLVADLTITDDGTETTVITEFEFSSLLLVISEFGQVIPFSHISGIDGPNKTFVLDFVTSDVTVLYLKSVPITSQIDFYGLKAAALISVAPSVVHSVDTSYLEDDLTPGSFFINTKLKELLNSTVVPVGNTPLVISVPQWVGEKLYPILESGTYEISYLVSPEVSQPASVEHSTMVVNIRRVNAATGDYISRLHDVTRHIYRAPGGLNSNRTNGVVSDTFLCQLSAGEAVSFLCAASSSDPGSMVGANIQGYVTFRRL